MHVSWKHLAIALAVLPIIALFTAWIGFFNVGASTGHWKVTEWFLGLAMRSAIRTYALGVEVPDELPRQAIQPAAAHFARGCAICHGAPGEARSPAMLKMLPQPPDLSASVGDWTDAQLYRIVKHGIRFTGMPAWPAQTRDDEVWAMVAFLRELPGMPPETYRHLAYGDAAPVLRATGIATTIAECTRCHGDDGSGRSPITPIIAGQKEAYLVATLHAYLAGDRPSGIMSLPVTAMVPADIPAVAQYYATLSAAGGEAGDTVLAGKGRVIFENGIRRRNVPACRSCHGAENRNPRYPRIAGQPADYIATQLELFKAGKRGGSDHNHLMVNAARELDDADIAAIAAYLSQLPPVDASK
jgi:cytochrome c553